MHLSYKSRKPLKEVMEIFILFMPIYVKAQKVINW